jgi:DNA-directed RNA polymerase subunit RPC12/RpoP
VIIGMLILWDSFSRFPRFFRKIYKCPNCKSYMYTYIEPGKDTKVMEVYCIHCKYKTTVNLKEKKND